MLTPSGLTRAGEAGLETTGYDGNLRSRSVSTGFEIMRFRATFSGRSFNGWIILAEVTSGRPNAQGMYWGLPVSL